MPGRNLVRVFLAAVAILQSWLDGRNNYRDMGAPEQTTTSAENGAGTSPEPKET